MLHLYYSDGPAAFMRQDSFEETSKNWDERRTELRNVSIALFHRRSFMFFYVNEQHVRITNIQYKNNATGSMSFIIL